MTPWSVPAALLIVVGTALIAFRRLPRDQAIAAVVLAGAGGLALMRQFPLAVPLALLGWSLLNRHGTPARPDPAGASEVRSDGLAMRLDHATGEMDGEVLSGPFAGRKLSELSAADLRDLADAFESAGDDDSLSLLLAYLDRRGGGHDRGSADPGEGPRTNRGADQGRMSEAEAYRILGLDPGANVEDVREAYRRLMRRVHPDLGGSSALAAMINAAKERLDPN